MYHKIYNRELRSFLLDCQHKGFLPGRDYVAGQCQLLQDRADYLSGLNGASESRESASCIDNAIDNMDYLPILTNTSNDGSTVDFPFLRVIGLIPLRGLTHKEISLIEECYGAHGGVDSGAYRVTLMSIRVSRSINDNTQDKLNMLAKRTARKRFAAFAISKGHQVDFRYPIFDRIRDYWLLSGV